jgi:hypothetical protein
MFSVGNKTLLLQTIVDVTAVADELNINQETFKEIEIISRNLCYDLHVQSNLALIWGQKKNMCVYGHPTYPNFC